VYVFVKQGLEQADIFIQRMAGGQYIKARGKRREGGERERKKTSCRWAAHTQESRGEGRGGDRKKIQRR